MGQSFCYDQICSCGQEALSYKNPTNNIEYCHPKREYYLSVSADISFLLSVSHTHTHLFANVIVLSLCRHCARALVTHAGRLHEECNYDSQCPANAYCSSQKLGCLCQNGYGSATVGSASGTEQAQCLPKTCRVSSDCESEFHRCEQDTSSSARLCMCVATHFDPTSAKCYKFGAQGGKSTDVSNNLLASNKTDATTTTTAAENNNNNKYSILDDLISKIRDNKLVMWLVLIVALVVFVIFVVLALLMLLYKDGHCWTTHKKEYEPHSDKHDTAKNGFLNKNKSINQKSFRQKSADALESANHDDAAAASSADDLLGSGHTAALEAPTTTTTATLEQNGKAKQYNNLGGSLLHSNIASKDDDRYVKVSLVKSTQQQQQYQHHVSVPLETSTSTPV